MEEGQITQGRVFLEEFLEGDEGGFKEDWNFFFGGDDDGGGKREG